MNILVVDDNAPVALLMAATLRGLAKRIEVAGTFYEAKEWIKRVTFDIILLDLGLPDSFPEQTIERVSEMRVGSTRVVLVTGQWPPNAKQTPETTGADGVLFKGDGHFREKLQALVSGQSIATA